MFAVEETLVLHNASARHTWENVSFEFATWLRPMQGSGYVEMQSGACAVCAVGQQASLQPPYHLRNTNTLIRTLDRLRFTYVLYKSRLILILM